MTEPGALEQVAVPPFNAHLRGMLRNVFGDLEKLARKFGKNTGNKQNNKSNPKRTFYGTNTVRLKQRVNDLRMFCYLLLCYTVHNYTVDMYMYIRKKMIKFLKICAPTWDSYPQPAVS
jgi:hypothetical protein